MKMSQIMALAGVATILGAGTLEQSASAAASKSARMEFRWNDAYDTSHRIPKWTTSGYIVRSTSVSNGYYTASAWGHSYLAGRTGNVDVSEGRSYKIYSNSNYVMHNKLVEWYGKGNNAYIWGVSHSNNSARGTWSADR